MPLFAVFDTHCDTILEWVNRGRDLGVRSGEGHVDLPRLREGGVQVQFFACFIEPRYKPDRGLPRVLQLIDAIHRMVAAYPEQVAVATTSAEIAAIRQSGRIAAVISIEGGEAIGSGDEATLLSGLRSVYRLGVRCLSLTWNERNLLADGAGDARSGGGLSNLGAAVVAEMNRLRMIVDVSHLSERGFWDVMEVSQQPVLASHSCCWALHAHRRNLKDDQIRALAQAGGVVGINFYPDFLTADPNQATLEHVLDHIEHALQVGGPDCVGLGADYDGIDTTPLGLEDATRYPALAEGLLRRGYSSDVVEKIMGGNHLRLFRQVVG